MPKPVCFTIMPYGRKPTQAEAGKGPAEIDFNALWDRAYVPVIQGLGYEPIRADQDTGALIINQMLERLFFAHLVLADMTIPNGNVYYEVGIRHAAQETGCVLLAADWSKQLFDVAQMRTVRYPLPEGDVVEATAQAIHAALKGPIAALATGRSPMHEAIKGYPGEVELAAASSMREHLEAVAALQASFRAVRAAPRAERMTRALALVAKHGNLPITAPVAVGLLRLLVGSAERTEDWHHVLAFIERMPADLADDAEFREQRAFALSNTGDPLAAIAALEALIELHGPTPERCGLLGGRYKRLLKTAATPAERLQYLADSIASYEQGMTLDLNDYYCAANLPRLYRQRARRGDEERAQAVLHLVIAACERAIKRGSSDEWVRPTLLGAAFDAADADKAEDLVDVVAAEGAARWKLDSTLADLEQSASQVKDGERRERLAALIERFRTLA